MKNLTFDIVLCLVIEAGVIIALLLEKMAREHLTIMDVTLQLFIPSLIVGFIINFPAWWLFGRRSKK